VDALHDVDGFELAQLLGEQAIAQSGGGGLRLGEPVDPMGQGVENRTGPAPARQLGCLVDSRGLP
jgi:hypothetical protein